MDGAESSPAQNTRSSMYRRYLQSGWDEVSPLRVHVPFVVKSTADPQYVFASCTVFTVLLTTKYALHVSSHAGMVPVE